MNRILAAVSLIFISAGSAFADPPKAVETSFNKDILKAAADYKSWGRVDDEVRFAPELCRLPNPGVARVSASKDEETHGQKLYSLFARNRWDYILRGPAKTAAVGQVVVKQSWVPEEITDPALKPAPKIDRSKIVTAKNPAFDPKDPNADPFSKNDHFYPYAWKGDKVFKAAKQADLFIMMKLDPKTPDTDEGWVYATVTSDGKTVTAAGKIESCMKCHVEAKMDRLFGLAK